MVKKVQFDPGAVLDRVISSAEPEDECYLYKLADFKKSGQLVDAFNSSGSKGLEDIVSTLETVYQENNFGDIISRADMWALMGIWAVENSISRNNEDCTL